MILVAVGSKNPPKLCAVQEVFSQVLGQVILVDSHDVDSGVPDQPWDKETEAGALRRCKEVVLAKEKADFHVGIEAGVFNTLISGEVLCAEIAYVHSNGIFTPGMSGAFVVPDRVATPMAFDGIPMSEAADLEYGTKDLGMKEGLVGIITNNLVRRQAYIAQAVMFALCAHLTNPKVRDA